MSTVLDPKSSVRTYFVAGQRVEQVRHAQGHSTWTCECEEFSGHRPQRAARWCQHVERVAAAVELQDLLRTPHLILPAASY